jgi:hypothetical protein
MKPCDNDRRLLRDPKTTLRRSNQRPTHKVHAYAYLAATLLGGEKLQLRDGRWMNRADLWSTAIGLARYPAEVFAFLGDTLTLGRIDYHRWAGMDEVGLLSQLHCL